VKHTIESKPHNQFKDYNFTPLNASIHEVLMEVKKAPEYVRLPRIPGNPPERNKDKYCTFHKANGHGTEGCIALRVTIEKFIGNGKLVFFFTKHRTQPCQNRDRQPRDYPPRDNRCRAQNDRRQENRP